jgi:hypothetical protein
MPRILCVALLLAVPLAAVAITEPKSETTYPDAVTVTTDAGDATLAVTGVGLREKTFMKVDVYTIVSYVAAGTDLGQDPGRGLVLAEAPKRIRMDLRRGFGRDKLIGSFDEVIEKNYDDVSAFADDMATFFGYFDRDAQEKDELIFDYLPGRGLTTTLNGEVKGTIANPAFAQALWTVWFGAEPADDGLKKDLLAALQP